MRKIARLKNSKEAVTECPGWRSVALCVARGVVEVMSIVRDDRGLEGLLSECRVLVVPALRTAVRAFPDSLWRVAGYHFGWLDEHGRPATARGTGKMVRSALALLTAQAVGGARVDAVPVAVELVHNFSVLHDDIIDGDRTRRHRPTGVGGVRGPGCGAGRGRSVGGSTTCLSRYPG